MWTIATPFIKRDQNIIGFWLEGFKRLKFPREEFKLLWIDMSNDPSVSDPLKSYLEENGRYFKEVEYIVNPKKKYKNVDREDLGNPNDNFFLRRQSIAETMQILNKHRDGNMVIYEDDIVPPEDAWLKMKEVFDWSPKFLGVTAVQYGRQIRWPALLAWDWVKKKTFGDKDTSEERNWSNVIREPERESGFDYIGSTATGFILLRKEFLDQYNFTADGTKGQDVMLGFYINGYDKDEKGGEGKLMIRWDVKLDHMGCDEQGRFKIYRSPFSNSYTPYNGIRF